MLDSTFLNVLTYGLELILFSLLRQIDEASDSGSGSNSDSGLARSWFDNELNAIDALSLIFRSTAAFVAIIIAIQICDVTCATFLAMVAQLADHLFH